MIQVAVEMGGFASKHELGLLEGDDDHSQCSSSPPVAAVPRKHFLPRELDPRSPTAGIDRTPIPVSAPQETVADPRSPSVGIVRTPMSACLLSLVSADLLLILCQFLLAGFFNLNFL